MCPSQSGHQFYATSADGWWFINHGVGATELTFFYCYPNEYWPLCMIYLSKWKSVANSGLPHIYLAAQFLAAVTRCSVSVQHAQGGWWNCHKCTGVSASEGHRQSLPDKEHTAQDWVTIHSELVILCTSIQYDYSERHSFSNEFTNREIIHIHQFLGACKRYWVPCIWIYEQKINPWINQHSDPSLVNL